MIRWCQYVVIYMCPPAIPKPNLEPLYLIYSVRTLLYRLHVRLMQLCTLIAKLSQS